MTDRSAVPPGALVTGGAMGIGHAIVVALARRGDRVVLTDIDEDAALQAAEGLRVRASTSGLKAWM